MGTNYKKMIVQDIVEITNGRLIIGAKEETCENFSIDTRKIQENDTFIGIKGERTDGSMLWKEALDNGAKIAIVENINFTYAEMEAYKAKNKIIIKVEDTLKALTQIAEYKRTLYDIPVVGVTGSVGKTSTKDIIANVVAQKYNTLKTEGNNNNHIGVPKTILRLKDEEAAVVEMGMSHLGEIRALSNIAKPTLAVITNVGTSHIGNLGSRQNILKAKLEILDGMKKKKIVINNDNDLLHKWYEENKSTCDIVTFGILNDSDYMAEEIIINENGSSFICEGKDTKIQIEVPVAGEHYIYNALCATAVGKTLDLTNEQIIEGIKTVEIAKKRMEVVSLRENIILVNDTYNASLESIKEALKYITTLPKGRKIAVLGDVLELGDFSEKVHEKIGEEVAKQNIDMLICCGHDSKNICRVAIENGMKKDKVYHENNIKNVLKRIKEEMKRDDVILLKASNGMKFFDIANDLIEKYGVQ